MTSSRRNSNIRKSAADTDSQETSACQKPPLSAESSILITSHGTHIKKTDSK